MLHSSVIAMPFKDEQITVKNLHRFKNKTERVSCTAANTKEPAFKTSF